MPIVADAAVAIRGDLSQFHRDLSSGADKGAQTLSQKIKSALSPRNLAVAGMAAGVAIGGALLAGLADAARALIDIERLNAQTDAAIRSTGGAANITRQQIEEAAEAAEAATTIQREAVQEAQNLLLTFTRVRNEAGEGNDIFNQATEAVLDMSVALGTDATSAAMQLGKALNDPIKGMAQLGRAGIQFTEEQKELVEQLVETGDILGAQKIILAELETQFGGSAEAFADTTAGRIQRFQNDVGNMFESIIVGATKVADFLGQDFDPLGNFAMDFGDQGATIHRLADEMGTDFQTMKDRINAAMHESGDTFEDVTAQMEQDAKHAAIEAEGWMDYGVRHAAEALERGGPVVAKEAGKIAGMFPHEIRARIQEIRNAAHETVVAFAAGLLEKQNDPMLAWEAMLRAQRDALTREAEITRLLGQLNSTELAAGLADGRREVRLAAQATAGEIERRLRDLGAWNWGYRTGIDYANGLTYSIPYVEGAARGVTSAVGRQLEIRSEPEAPDSGLRGITKWGGNIVRTIAEGMLGELGTGASAARALSSVLMPSMGMPSVAAVTPTATGGVTYQLVVNGVPRTFASRTDFMDALDDLGAFGEGRLSG